MRISKEIFPRPVALVCTVNKEGRPNVMTASFLTPVSFEPKYVAFAISPKRYSFENLKEVKEFTLNILGVEDKEMAMKLGRVSGRDVDKFMEYGVEKEKSEKVKPPCIKCPVTFECKVAEMKQFGDHYLVVGKVVSERVRKERFSPLLHYTGNVFMSGEVV